MIDENRTFAEKLINAIKKAIEKFRNFFKENPLEAKTEYGQALLEAMNKVENRVQELWDKAVAEGIRAEKVDVAESKKQLSERAARLDYDTLIKKPDMKIAMLSGNVYNRADTVFYAKKNAAKIGKRNSKNEVSVYVEDLGSDVILTDKGLRHGLTRKMDLISPVTVRIGEIIKHSIKLNELNPKSPNADNTYVLIGAAKTKSEQLVIVRCIVNRYNNQLQSVDTLYAVNAKKESAATVSPSFANNSLPVTDSTISISDLLDYVNKYFPYILPESVLRHFGYERRPEGKIGESALYSDRFNDTDYLSAVECGDMATAQKMVDEAAEVAFSNSKIRDEDGKLIKVYHGTDSDFTVFDKSKGRSNADIQGMFFSPWEIDASGYGDKVGIYYLNITNPANESTGYRALRKYQGQNYVGIKAREYLETQGFDGVNNSDEEFIAFNSEQIKSADPVTYDDDGNVSVTAESKCKSFLYIKKS